MLFIFAVLFFFTITLKAAVIHAPLYQNDQALLAAFSPGHDVSQSTYSQVLERRKAKRTVQRPLGSLNAMGHQHRVEVWVCRQKSQVLGS